MRAWIRIAAVVCLLAGAGSNSVLFAQKLPQGLSRFNPAGLPTDWIYEGTAFRMLGSATAGTLPVVRLWHDVKGYLLAATEEQVRSAVNAGFIRERTAFYAPLSDGIPVHRFRSKRDGSYSYALSSMGHEWTDEGVAFHAFPAGAGPVSATTIDVARYRNASTGQYLYTASNESRYQVGAFYFGTFSAGGRNIVEGTYRVYGARPKAWWGGVQDFFGKEPGVPVNRQGWEGDWSHLKPAIGYYDQGAVQTLERHITQAADAGLAFFSFYWYPSRGDGNESLAEGLRGFLGARNRDRMKFNLALYSHPWADDMAIDSRNLSGVIERLVGYFMMPNYLRLPDGRAVFIVGDHRNIRGPGGEKCSSSPCFEEAVDAFVAALRSRAKSAGVELFIQFQQSGPGWERVRGGDGTSCIIPPFPLGGALAYPRLSESAFDSLRVSGKPVSPCMLQNFDERPRQEILVKDRSAIRYLVGKTDELFRANLLATKQFSDRSFLESSHPTTRIVYLYAWNEWHEGGILEPNVASGARDLNIVTDVFQLPRVYSPCLDRNRC